MDETTRIQSINRTTCQCCCLARNILVLLRQWAVGHLRRLESFLCGLCKTSVSCILHWHTNSTKGRISPHCQKSYYMNILVQFLQISVLRLSTFWYLSSKLILFTDHAVSILQDHFWPLLRSWRTLEVIRPNRFLANWIDHSTSCFHFQNIVLEEFIITLLFTLLDLLT